MDFGPLVSVAFVAGRSRLDVEVHGADAVDVHGAGGELVRCHPCKGVDAGRLRRPLRVQLMTRAFMRLYLPLVHGYVPEKCWCYPPGQSRA